MIVSYVDEKDRVVCANAEFVCCRASNGKISVVFANTVTKKDFIIKAKCPDHVSLEDINLIGAAIMDLKTITAKQIEKSVKDILSNY